MSEELASSASVRCDRRWREGGGAPRAMVVRLGIDCGNVMSHRGVQGAEGETIHTGAWEGFYAFALLFGANFGFDNLFIISRTNTGNWYSYRGRRQIETWVVRFVRSLGFVDLGMPVENIHLCRDRSGRDGKGRIAERCQLTHFIDDHLECHWSVLEDSEGNAMMDVSEAL